VNRFQNKTSWDPPTVCEEIVPESFSGDGIAAENVLTLAATEADEPLLADTREPEVEEPGPPLSEEDALPEGWIEVADPSTGEAYFYNETTGETIWERPFIAASEEFLEQNDTPLVNSGVLPNGWEKVDAGNGEFYYHNQALGQTQWEPPVNPNPAPEIVASNVMQSSTGTSQTNQSRGRPAHAFATFGFGGKLCVWRVSGGQNSSVEIYRSRDIVPTHELVQAEASKQQLGISGPLDTAELQNVETYLKQKIERNPKDLLWPLVRISSTAKGRLRTAAGLSDLTGPENAVVDLLLKEGVSSVSTETQNVTDARCVPGPTQSIEEARNGNGKLCRGKVFCVAILFQT
jgi:hypothetical protein